MKEVKNYKKGKREQIFELLEKQGYILDQQLFNIFGDESGIYNGQEHIRAWTRLNADKNFFKDKKIKSVRKSHRCHLAELENGDNYKIGKEFHDLFLTPPKR